MQREARLRGLHNSASANYCIQERGRINETNSIISPPILVAKPNQQKGGGGGGVISSEYGTYLRIDLTSHFMYHLLL